MFETSMVLAAKGPTGRRIGLLTASLTAHTALVIGAIVLSVASTEFPQEAPGESTVYRPVAAPPLLGTPGGGAPPRQAVTPPPPPRQQPAPPSPITAPPAVPNDVPEAEGPPGAPGTTPSGEGLNEGPIGVPGGDPHGAGDLQTPPSVVQAPPAERIYEVGSGVTPPVAIHKVQPPYPPSMVRIGMPATVVVRCVIDRNGRVRDPQVVVPAMQPFNEEVVRAVRQWRFRPGSLNGQAVEVYLELKVHFSVVLS